MLMILLVYLLLLFYLLSAALLKIQKDRQERRVREEEERRERERQEAEELVRKMHEDACDEPLSIGASLSISEGPCESELDQMNKDLEAVTSSISPVTMVRNFTFSHICAHDN